MEASVIVATIAALAAIFAAFLTYKSSSKANTVADRKVDQEAYDRAIRWRDEELSRVTQQAERMALQIDKISGQLASEQDVSNVLRNQVRILQNQVETLKQMVDDLKNRTQGRALTPLPIAKP